MRSNLWTREEMLLALNLYLKLPFGRAHGRDRDVIHLAQLIGRTPASIAMRLANFAHIDSYHSARGVKGLANGRRQCEPIWNQYLADRENILFESERLLAGREQQNVDVKYRNLLDDLPDLVGEEKIREIKTRVNQVVFRQIVLANYGSTCVISGIKVPRLLVASHIIPWSSDASTRLDPENGLCLSAIHDKAFDSGLIAIDTDYKVLISKEIADYRNQPFFEPYFGRFEHKRIAQAEKYQPRKEFLEHHLQHVFKY